MRFIELDTEQKLRIYTLPLRQRIIREMSILGRPVTSKQIADRLSITPPSAQHHIKKLMSIGLIEEDHIEIINGIRARYLKLSDVTVRIGNIYGEVLSDTRKAFMDSNIEQIYTAHEAVLKAHPNQIAQHPFADMITGIVHLSDEDAEALSKMIVSFMNSHRNEGVNTHPWEMAVIAYRMDDQNG